ncbi:hypothetical protein [Saccharopolyspora sp. ASAGF58]|nr:hypothetical protein [Saccharopolyspora sp. ASAGF58]
MLTGLIGNWVTSFPGQAIRREFTGGAPDGATDAPPTTGSAAVNTACQ